MYNKELLDMFCYIVKRNNSRLNTVKPKYICVQAPEKCVPSKVGHYTVLKISSCPVVWDDQKVHWTTIVQ